MNTNISGPFSGSPRCTDSKDTICKGPNGGGGVAVKQGGRDNFVRGLLRWGKCRKGKFSPPLQIPKLALRHAHTALPKPPDFARGKFRQLP